MGRHWPIHLNAIPLLCVGVFALSRARRIRRSRLLVGVVGVLGMLLRVPIVLVSCGPARTVEGLTTKATTTTRCHTAEDEEDQQDAAND
jgi:hypothetical protein